MIICAKYKKNPSRTVDATERTRFSKSRLNDLEDIGQGQGSSHATHPLMLLIICTKYGKNPSWTVDATGRTWKVNGQTDGQTDRVNPPNFVAGGIIIIIINFYCRLPRYMERYTKDPILVIWLVTTMLYNTRQLLISCVAVYMHRSIYLSCTLSFSQFTATLEDWERRQSSSFSDWWKEW